MKVTPKNEHNRDNRTTESLSSRNYHVHFSLVKFHLTADFPDLESDGRLLRQVGDPPRQRSHSIQPGDPARETYRLSTFKLLPRKVQVDVRKLASAGFYFTGCVSVTVNLTENGKSKMTRSYSDGIDPIVTSLTERIQETN
ncbi:uncharacterized protein LOC143458985 [Clavelina lepadiformis]|uniref:uncharacterized protein LOC143458985 n=1 Tax=Clavelina lepadiformis TaxID=159417 RepID=UPI004042E117